MCCVTPDSLIRLQEGRDIKIARKQIKTANYARRVFLQLDRRYSSLFCQPETKQNDEHENIPLLRDVHTELTAGIHASPDPQD